MYPYQYKTLPQRKPRKADAAKFRNYWQSLRHSISPSCEFMRRLAHDYWIAKRYGE